MAKKTVKPSPYACLAGVSPDKIVMVLKLISVPDDNPRPVSEILETLDQCFFNLTGRKPFPAELALKFGDETAYDPFSMQRKTAWYRIFAEQWRDWQPLSDCLERYGRIPEYLRHFTDERRDLRVVERMLLRELKSARKCGLDPASWKDVRLGLALCRKPALLNGFLKEAIAWGNDEAADTIAAYLQRKLTGNETTLLVRNAIARADGHELIKLAVFAKGKHAPLVLKRGTEILSPPELFYLESVLHQKMTRAQLMAAWKRVGYQYQIDLLPRLFPNDKAKQKREVDAICRRARASYLKIGLVDMADAWSQRISQPLTAEELIRAARKSEQRLGDDEKSLLYRAAQLISGKPADQNETAA